MQICDGCLGLIGKDSSAEPHAALRSSGATMMVSVSVSPKRQIKTATQWHCTECGTWMYQCTEHEIDTPNKWRSGTRPADWPEGLPDARP